MNDAPLKQREIHAEMDLLEKSLDDLAVVLKDMETRLVDGGVLLPEMPEPEDKPTPGPLPPSSSLGTDIRSVSNSLGAYATRVRGLLARLAV
jgi:hypothetical protein